MGFMRSSRWRWKIDPRPHRARSAWDEFSRYEFDRYRNGDLHTDYPTRPKGGDHDIDACRYALDLDIKRHYTPKVWSLPKAYRRSYGG